ncbi:MAG: hypothetical protein KF861_15735, partial [Planctomycetaceae bacterium]|nr:hypothetical protein [Planctomycetaceae bacterium]
VVRLRPDSTLSLPAATAVLNSDWAAEWFSRHAKRRGAALDISGAILREFPMPQFSEQVAERLMDLCRLRQQAGVGTTSEAGSGGRATIQDLEREIEELSRHDSRRKRKPAT